jgi:hypothetical protein
LRAHTEFDAKSEARKSDSVRARNRVDTELRTDSKSGVGIDAEANADSAAKYNSVAGWGFGVAKVGVGLGTELRTYAQSGVGINPEAHAGSTAECNSEAGWGAHSESGLKSELRQSDSARARNRAGCGIGSECGVGRGYKLRGLRGIRSR